MKMAGASQLLPAREGTNAQKHSQLGANSQPRTSLMDESMSVARIERERDRALASIVFMEREQDRVLRGLHQVRG